MAWNFGAGQWWRTPDSLIRLALQVDEAWPKRDRTPDGTAASSSHTAQNPNSDHEPGKDPYGVVAAIDIAHNTGPDGADMEQVAEAIRQSEDPRVKYVIRQMDGTPRMFSSYPKGVRYPPFTWRPYSGSNPHSSHMHVSVWNTADLYDDDTAWNIGADEMTPEQEADLAWLREVRADLELAEGKSEWTPAKTSAKWRYLEGWRDGVVAISGVDGSNGAALAAVTVNVDGAGLTVKEVNAMIAKHADNPDAHHE